MTTLRRAEEFAGDSDEILQVMFYPPNQSEQRYHRTQRARLDRAAVIHKLFIMSEEDSDDEPST